MVVGIAVCVCVLECMELCLYCILTISGQQLFIFNIPLRIIELFSILFHSHRLALVSSQSSENPAHYLEPDDRMLSVMSGASPSAMLVLCVHMPGKALLEIMDSIRQNVSFFFIVMCKFILGWNGNRD